MPRPLTFLLDALLGLSLFAFALDLIHMIYHLIENHSLWNLPGVPQKLAIKILTLLFPAILMSQKKRWRAWLLSLVVFGFLIGRTDAVMAATSCEKARELLSKSGVARDAKENIFGHVKVDPPKGSFPSDMDKITWWGVFSPFEFWESPEFEAAWINPQGQEVARDKFRGNKCRLAKNTVRGENQPRGEFRDGMWKVVVTCDDYVIDRRDFAVTPPPGARPQGPDAPGKPEEGAMIWAKDMLNEK